MFANAGMVVKVLPESSKGVVRMPMTPIWPPTGVVNAMVPRPLAVTGYAVERTNAAWPDAGSEVDTIRE